MFGDLEDLDKMFGELDDSDIYVNNQDNSFDNSQELNIPDEPAADMQQQQPPQAEQQAPKKGGNSIVFLLIIVIAAAAIYLYKTYYMPSPAPEPAQTVDASAEMGDYFYDKAQGENPSAPAPAQSENGTVVDVDINSNSQPQQAAEQPQAANAPAPVQNAASDVSALKNNEQSNLKPVDKKNVEVAVSNGGRLDPFVPFITAVDEEKVLIEPPKFDIIAPPSDIPGEINPVYDTMVATKISGIMYDKARPSAIINVDGADQLVHKGDFVKEYQIIDITKDRVVLKNGTNIYRASVGQEVEGSVNINPVSNLSRQFGGAYKAKSGNIIEINGSN